MWDFLLISLAFSNKMSPTVNIIAFSAIFESKVTLIAR